MFSEGFGRFFHASQVCRGEKRGEAPLESRLRPEPDSPREGVGGHKKSPVRLHDRGFLCEEGEGDYSRGIGGRSPDRPFLARRARTFRCRSQGCSASYHSKYERVQFFPDATSAFLFSSVRSKSVVFTPRESM